MKQVLEVEKEQVKDIQIQEIEDDWQLDVAMCRLDGHAMMDGELCEACQ